MNMELVKYMLDGILLSLLLGALGLLVWFHIRLNKLMANYGKMPQLSEIFGENLVQATEGVNSLSEKIGNQVMEANKTLQEIEYVLDRAEKIMVQFDSRFEHTKPQNIKSMITKKSEQQKIVKKNMAPITSKNKAVLPQNVVPKVIKQVNKPDNSANEALLKGRLLGGIKKEIKAFKPKQLEKGSRVVFKNTTISGGTSAYGAAASAIQKSGGGKKLATEQEAGLIKALEERL